MPCGISSTRATLPAAITNAFKACPLTARFFALLKRLELLFGLGQGLALDKAVEGFLGQIHRRHLAPCSHRSAGYLSSVPGRFLYKYTSFYATLVCRLQHALDGRGSYAFSKLKAIAFEFSDPELIIHGLFLHAFCDAVVGPVMLRCQDSRGAGRSAFFTIG